MNDTLVVSLLLGACGLYLLLGFGFGLFFVLRGVQQVDPTALESGWGFRLIILPGVLVFWPLLLRRWVCGQNHPPGECSPHRCAACRSSCISKGKE